MKRTESDLDYDTLANFLPKLSQQINVPEEKFLFFFNSKLVNEKFIFGLEFRTGVYIFSIVVLIQSLGALFKIFSPDSFWIFIISIFAFLIYFIIAFYSFFGAMKNNYSYIKISYLLIAIFFLIEALIYLVKCVIKVILFITPWDNDFLKLDFLIYVFGYGVYLFIYLYLIYVLYRFMLQIKKGEGRNENNDMEDLYSDIDKNE